VFLVKTTDSVCNQALLAAIEITHCSDVQNLAVDHFILCKTAFIVFIVFHEFFVAI